MRSGDADRVIAQLAGRAHGIVTRAELLRARISAAQVKQRVARRSLITVHRGVYHVGHGALGLAARYTAAVKACGERAALCDLAAAHLWGLVKGRPPAPAVLAPGTRDVAGLAVHRADNTDPRDVVTRHGIPLTSVPRTIVDLAGLLPEAALARAVHEAQVRYRTTPRHVEAVLARRPSSRGARTLRRVLHGDVKVTLSRLESRFLTLLDAAGLPLPETNQVAGSRRVDCRWPQHRLTVELDSYRFHNTRQAWERDRQREREARTRGDEFRRYTSADAFEDTSHMLADLAALLDRS